MLCNKTVLIGVTGSIAAYKIANLSSMLIKKKCDVHVIMTKNATNFINPITFETITGNKCIVDTFDRNFQYNVEHISLAKKADVMLIAPASANVIGKIANGIADDMLTTTVMACKCKIIISPTMNTNMYNNIIVQDNISKLKKFNFEVIKPDKGFLACRDEGDGKMPSEKVLFDYIEREINFKYNKDLEGKKVLVTAGATQESIDPVRYITNHSTGKMGYALAKIAMLRGADVLLISGKTNLDEIPFINTISVTSAKDMFLKVKENFSNFDIIIKAAAVSDYTPIVFSNEKIKKKDESMEINLKKTTDILKYIGENRSKNQFICGFSMETENMIENSKAKLYKKNIDMIIANNLKEKGAGFGVDTNKITIITKDEEISFDIMNKYDVANIIIDKIKSIIN